MASSLPSQDGRKKIGKPRTAFIAPALPLIPTRATQAQLKVKRSAADTLSKQEPTSDSNPPTSVPSPATHQNLTNGTSDLCAAVTRQATSSENGTQQADSITVISPSSHGQETAYGAEHAEVENFEELGDTDSAHEIASSVATTPRPSLTANCTPVEPSQTMIPAQKTDDIFGLTAEATESSPNHSLAYSESPLNTDSSQFLANIPIQEPSPMRDWNQFQHMYDDKFDWAEDVSSQTPQSSETLHMPPMPKLPELHAESSSPTGVRQLRVTNGNGPDQPPRPVFGAGNEEELEISSNGYSHSLSSTETRNSTEISMDNVSHMKQLFKGKSFPACQFRPPRPRYDSNNERVASITDHMDYLYRTRSFSEWLVQVVPPNTWDVTNAHRIHGAVLSRSRPLQEAMFSRQFNLEGDLILTLHSPRYIDFAAFESALGFLYTNELMDMPDHYKSPLLDKAMKFRRVTYIMSYLMSGYVLGVQEIADQGLDLLESSTDWDIAELIVQAALDMTSYFPGGGAPTSRALTPDYLSPNKSTLSLTDVPGHIQSKKADPVEVLTGSTRESNAILKRFMDCIAKKKLDLNLRAFRLQTDPSDTLPSYLPNIREHSGGSRKLSNQALTSITFGSMPSMPVPTAHRGRTPQPIFSSEAANTNASRDKITAAEEAFSAILLNIPFQQLEFFFYNFMSMFDEEDVLDLFQRVIHERELMRQRVLLSNLVPDKIRLANRKTWAIVGRKEALRRAGRNSKLTSTWTGFENPAK